jgi:hypothetical protein
MKKFLLVLALAAVAAPSAAAGGWATVGLSSTPAGTGPGDRWSVDLTVLQHGKTPLEGIAPVLTISNTDGETHSFTGTPAGEPGVYRVDVVFPSTGTWSYEVWDGFSRTHTYTPVEIVVPGAFPWLTLLLGVASALVLAAATVALLRRRSGRPAPQPSLRGAS